MRVLYRADGGHPIGTGHLFRATRVLGALRERTALEARLLTAEDPDGLRIARRAPAEILALPPRADSGAVKPLLRAAPVLEHISVWKPDLVVVDMLDTPDEDMAALASTGVPLITLDDRGPGRVHADTLINVLVEEPQPDRLPAGVRLLEGGAYVVIDPLFGEAHARPAPRQFGRLRRVFVSLGGADAAGLTLKVARALCRLDDLERVEFGCGPAFPHRPALEDVLQDAPWEHEIRTGLPSLIDEYQWADLSMVAGGLTMYEVCCVGAPALAVCQPIDHQLELAERLSGAGAMATVGYGLEVTEEQIAGAVRGLADESIRRRMSEQGPRIVDGRGTARVAEALLETTRRKESAAAGGSR